MSHELKSVDRFSIRHRTRFSRSAKIVTADARICFQLSRVTLLVGLISDPYLRELARRNWQSNYVGRGAVSNDFVVWYVPVDFIRPRADNPPRRGRAFYRTRPTGRSPLSPLAMRIAIGDES
jgi:hypothetical protein